MQYYSTIYELCGHTPIVQLQQMSDSNNVYVKLESLNPGRSIKDRAVLEMIKEAEASGELRPEMTIVESTSGNTGIAIALYGRRRGYKVLCIVDENIPAEKLALLHAYGAQTEIIHATPSMKNADLTELRMERIKQLVSSNHNYVNLNQYKNKANPLAHERYTAEEILQQAPENIKAIVISVGTGGTITGLSTIKVKRPDILIYGVEPEGSTIFGGEKGVYLQQGPGNYFKPEVMNFTHIDGHYKVSDYHAFKTARELSKKEGLLLGGSSGAVVFAALQLGRDIGRTGSVVAVCPDIGTKYLDTIYSDEWMLEHKLLDHDYEVQR